MLSYPEANIPVVQLYLLSSLDPVTHIKMGEALEPLRSQGVLIYASGMSFHNMQVFESSMNNSGSGSGSGSISDLKSVDFDNYIKEAVGTVVKGGGKGNTSYEERKKKVDGMEGGTSCEICTSQGGAFNASNGGIWSCKGGSG